MEISSLLSTSLAILSLATLAGLGLTRGQITSLREQLSDSRAETAAIRISRSEELAERNLERAEDIRTRTEDRALRALERAKFETDIATLTSEVTALRRVVTGEVQWSSISEMLEKHHEDSIEHWTKTENGISELIRQVKGGPG